VIERRALEIDETNEDDRPKGIDDSAHENRESAVLFYQSNYNKVSCGGARKIKAMTNSVINPAKDYARREGRSRFKRLPSNLSSALPTALEKASLFLSLSLPLSLDGSFQPKNARVIRAERRETVITKLEERKRERERDTQRGRAIGREKPAVFPVSSLTMALFSVQFPFVPARAPMNFRSAAACPINPSAYLRGGSPPPHPPHR